jgi:LysM repeat protein
MKLGLRKMGLNLKQIQYVENVSVKESTENNDYNVVIYFIKPNDTLWKIAKKFKVNMESLANLNGIENPDVIYPGEKIFIVR